MSWKPYPRPTSYHALPTHFSFPIRRIVLLATFVLLTSPGPGIMHDPNQGEWCGLAVLSPAASGATLQVFVVLSQQNTYVLSFILCSSIRVRLVR